MSVVVTYRSFKVKEGTDPRRVKQLICRDASWGTFMEELTAARACCGDASAESWRRLEPTLTNRVEGGPTDQIFTLDFPDENFDLDGEGVDHLVATVAGDVVLHRDIETLEVDGIEFSGGPYRASFPGPSVGRDSLYTDLVARTLRGEARPILAFTVKPRRGLTTEDLERLYVAAAQAGIDIVEDDERLVDSVGCRFEDRVRRIARLQRDFPSLYSANISGDSKRALDRLDFCAAEGLRMVKVDVLASGFETLRRVALRIRTEYAGRIAITVYPDALGAYRRLTRRFILTLCRLCGADVIYAGSANWARYQVQGGLPADALEAVYSSHRLLSEPIPGLPDIAPTLPTLTNDQHPSRAELLTLLFRRQHAGHHRFAFFVGGGISAFPGDITQACSTWMACLRHAALTPLAAYAPHDFGERIEGGMRGIGWERLDAAAALRD